MDLVTLGLIISAVLNGVFLYILYRLLFDTIPNRESVIEIYEDYFSKSKDYYQQTLSNLRRIDLRGAFESDDEVGVAFKFIKKSIEDIDELFNKTKQLNDNPEEQKRS